MKITWDNPEKTYVRVELMGVVSQIPTDERHPDWANIKAMLDAGTLVIPDYEAPETEGQ